MYQCKCTVMYPLVLSLPLPVLFFPWPERLQWQAYSAADYHHIHLSAGYFPPTLTGNDKEKNLLWRVASNSLLPYPEEQQAKEEMQRMAASRPVHASSGESSSWSS